MDSLLHGRAGYGSFTEGYHEGREKEDMKMWLRLAWSGKEQTVYPGEMQTLGKEVCLEMR
jgi:hypothetical protein